MKNGYNPDRGSLSIISDALPNLKGAARKVAQFVLHLPQETINLSITELAARVGVSEASIVRFAQSLGFSGFHALKIRLAEDIVSPMLLVHEDLMPDDDPAIAVQKAMTMGLRSLEDTANILDPSALEASIRVMCNSRQIVLFASGNSIPIALDLDFRLTKIGLLSRFFNRPDDAGNVCRIDIARTRGRGHFSYGKLQRYRSCPGIGEATRRHDHLHHESFGLPSDPPQRLLLVHRHSCQPFSRRALEFQFGGACADGGLIRRHMY